jgi:hypothetical protein
MIYFNGRPVSGAGIGIARNNNEGGALGFWPWGTAQWRYYFGMEEGRVVSRQGPVWLSEGDAQTREADIVETGLVQGRSISPVRFDWDAGAGEWRRA